MKANIFTIILSILSGALISYGFHAAGASTPLIACTGLLCTLSLVLGMGISWAEYPRTSMLLHTLGWVFFVLFLGLNILLGVLGAGESLLIILNGILVIVLLGASYFVTNAKQ
ncbi:hypothetical protein [Alistipes sp.]|uniref:hypothetical protein n=1 Tax=Alistipes sp. TaxID=1872444 RepID=UPI0025BCF0B3|nr:hypothetical protein [Alistipes sp.]